MKLITFEELAKADKRGYAAWDIAQPVLLSLPDGDLIRRRLDVSPADPALPVSVDNVIIKTIPYDTRCKLYPAAADSCYDGHVDITEAIRSGHIKAYDYAAIVAVRAIETMSYSGTFKSSDVQARIQYAQIESGCKPWRPADFIRAIEAGGVLYDMLGREGKRYYRKQNS